MKKIVLLLTFFILGNKNLVAKTWAEILKEKELILKNDNSYKIICEQCLAFINKAAPTIANPIIKNINIIENNEKLVDANDIQNSFIYMMPDAPVNKPFYDSIYNSGLPSASKMRLTVWNKLEKTLFYLNELAELFNYKPGRISIKIFEALRDLKTQEILFKNKFNEIKLNNALLNDEEVEIETSKWVSPVKNNVPVHSTGAAIDIRLWDNQKNEFLDLGKFGVIWGANNEAPTFSENLSDEQKLNRLYLLMATAKSGLVNYVYEYWHFSIGDRYAAFWQEEEASKRLAVYGPAKNDK